MIVLCLPMLSLISVHRMLENVFKLIGQAKHFDDKCIYV